MNPKHPRDRLTVQVGLDLAERAKNAAYDRGMTVAAFLVNAITKYTIDAEVEHNEGKPFPPRPLLGVPPPAPGCNPVFFSYGKNKLA